MNNQFKILLEEVLNQTDKMILEFANVGPREHKWGIDIKFHIMQPDKKKLRHGPRLKFYNNSWTSGPNFTITISEKPIVVGDYTHLVSKSELALLIRSVIKYRIPLLNFWNDPSHTVGEMLEQMEMIDNGKKVELVTYG
jgi:hypothetical protein